MAIAKAMPAMPNLSELHLEDTNLSDELFAMLLKAIYSEIFSFKAITYKGSDNCFDQQSYEILQKILLRQIPFNLQELAFENIKIAKTLQAKLIQSISRYGLIEKLSIAGI